MKKNILIYGAGAIGRGYLPWVFSPELYEYSYVETNSILTKLLQQRKKFTTYQTGKASYKPLQVVIKGCHILGHEQKALKQVDLIIIAVGPRNVPLVAQSLKGVDVPIVLAENEPGTVDIIKSVTGNKRTFFAIPDVITSNTAPENLLKTDPLAITTEQGICYIDKAVSYFKSSAKYISKQELQTQWMAKMYLHNTPHCIAAYMGSCLKLKYLHQAMEYKTVHKIVEGAMNEMKKVLIERFRISNKFVSWYAAKELRRFSNKLLFDPVSRVAREPFRKLDQKERLIGAAQLCLSSGIVPLNIIKGITAACYYKNPNDADAHINYLVEALDTGDFLSIILSLEIGSALYELLLEHWPSNSMLIEIPAAKPRGTPTERRSTSRSFAKM